MEVYNARKATTLLSGLLLLFFDNVDVLDYDALENVEPLLSLAAGPFLLRVVDHVEDLLGDVSLYDDLVDSGGVLRNGGSCSELLSEKLGRLLEVDALNI